MVGEKYTFFYSCFENTHKSSGWSMGRCYSSMTEGGGGQGKPCQYQYQGCKYFARKEGGLRKEVH